MFAPRARDELGTTGIDVGSTAAAGVLGALAPEDLTLDTVVTDARICTSDELIDELAKGQERDVLGRLAGISARLEMDDGHQNDGRLFNQLAAATLGTAFVEASGRSLRPEALPLPTDELFRMANGVPSREPGVAMTGRDLTEHNSRMMLRLFAQHEAYLGPLKPGLGRTELLLGELLPAALNGRPNPLDALTKATGASYLEARAFFLGAYAWTLGSARNAAPFMTRATFSNTRDPDRAWEVATSFAATRADLYARRLRWRGYQHRDNDDFRYTFSVLRDRPLVRLDGGELVAPVARHLSLAFCNGIYDFLEAHFAALDGEAQENFNRVFGNVTDAYVRERFRRDLGEGSYVPLPQVRGQLSPDGVTADGDCVFELKGKRLLRGIVTSGDLRAAPGFLGGRRGLGRGVAQLLSEIARTRAGHGRGLARNEVDTTVLCLVTPDGLPGFHLAPLRRWVLRAFYDVLREEFPAFLPEIGALERLEWLSFDELDVVVRSARIAGCSVGRLLRRFRLEAPDHPVDARTNALPPTLRGWLLARYPEAHREPWRDEAFARAWDDCTMWMFDRRIHDEPRTVVQGNQA